MILTGCNVANFGQNLHKFFLEARHHRADKNSKIIAIEPMNRKAVRPFRATKAERSEQTK
jgi:hypothetical protein